MQYGRCIWSSDSELQIDLGEGATIVPGSGLSFASEGIGLRTKNLVSDTATGSFIIEGPLLLTVPEISLWGTTVSCI